MTIRLTAFVWVVSWSAVAAAAGDIEVIFTEVPGHPTAIVPGAVDINGEPAVTEWKAMELLSLSPDGTQWIIKGRNYLGSDVETMLVYGSATTGAVLAQEGQPVHDGAEGEVYDFFGSGRARFNDLNQYVYVARARGGDSATKQKGIYYDGKTWSIVREESDPALGLVDVPANPTGDELFGNSFGSMHLMNDGTIGYQDSTIQNIHFTRRPAIFYNDTSFAQSGVTNIGTLAGSGTWDSLDANDFHTTPDGARWTAQGDDEGDEATDDILTIDGNPVIREGTEIGTSGVMCDAIFATQLLGDGTWLSRGDDPADNDWVVRNGALVTKTGDPITEDATETWGDSIVAVTGNTIGDFIVIGRTNGSEGANDVVVLNGSEVVAREGDAVDLDGNGIFDDNAFLGRSNDALSTFQPDDAFLTDDRVLYLLVELRDEEGNDLGGFGTGGDAFVRIPLDSATCLGDIDGSGQVGINDLLLLLANVGVCPDCPPSCDGDLNEDCTVNVVDLLTLLGAWGGCK